MGLLFHRGTATLDKRRVKIMYDLIIIGSGPAGLSAAVYGKRAGLNLLIIEEKPMSGGQILNTYEVDNYLGFPGISGFDMGMTFRHHAEKLGAEFLEATVHSVEERGDYKCVYAGNQELETRTVIFATGAEHARLGVPGEEELNGMGVSYCATCDGAFYKDRIAVVVGGGNVAAEDAVFLSGLCEKVYLVHRRDTLRADKALQEKVFACENIEMVWDSIPQEILGQEEVTGLKIRNVKTGEERELEADGVFIAVGIVPSTALVKDQLKLDENGYICAGEEGVTSAPGVFAAGDIRTKALRQVVTAVSDGANAVASAQKYLWRTDNGNH